jgi:protein-L-isoaspartate(D-aspartate) O-methyltransferase
LNQPLQHHRDFYAQLVVGNAGSQDPRLIAAFAQVPREHYMGPGPWPIHAGSGYISTVSDNPALLYQDVLVGLAPERGINNGQPSLHARCLAACAIAPGETVLHIGAGTGYYSAILAHLVGPAGRVIAFEIEADLAQRARANLQHLPQVTVRNASGSAGALPEADVIYVNAGATHPLPAWLDALKPGGRLVFPLTPDEGYGCMPLVTRQGPDSYAVRMLARVSFIPCIAARDPAASQALARAVETQSIHAVKSLRRGTPPDHTAWYSGNGWWLSTAGPD